MGRQPIRRLFAHLSFGLSVLAIEDHFKPRHIKALREYCRELIRESIRHATEGYQSRVHVFEMFGYGFVLTYMQEDEFWELEVTHFPNFRDPDGPHKLPRKAKIRTFRALEDYLRGLGRATKAIGERIVQLWERVERVHLSPIRDRVAAMMTSLRRDRSTMAGVSHTSEMLCNIGIPHHGLDDPQESLPPLPIGNNLEQQMRWGCVEMGELVLIRASGALASLGDIFSWKNRSLIPSVDFSGLWDPELFGRLQQPATG